MVENANAVRRAGRESSTPLQSFRVCAAVQEAGGDRGCALGCGQLGRGICKHEGALELRQSLVGLRPRRGTASCHGLGRTPPSGLRRRVEKTRLITPRVVEASPGGFVDGGRGNCSPGLGHHGGAALYHGQASSRCKSQVRTSST